MDLVRALTELDDATELHCARLLLLLRAFAGDDGAGRIEGLTKLAKLDFLLRYPVMLECALGAKGRSATGVQVEDHERHSVESEMVRYRFGPWDHRYRELLNLLVAKGLAEISVEGRTITVGLTEDGLSASSKLSCVAEFDKYAERATILRRHFNLTGTNLMKFIYDTFPEILDLRSNTPIAP